MARSIPGASTGLALRKVFVAAKLCFEWRSIMFRKKRFQGYCLQDLSTDSNPDFTLGDAFFSTSELSRLQVQKRFNQPHQAKKNKASQKKERLIFLTEWNVLRT